MFGPALALLHGMKGFTGKFGAGSETEKRQSEPAGRSQMRSLKYAVLLGILALSLGSAANAQVRVAVGVGPVGIGIGAAPVCSYGYYGFYPYACAPYGYYGPSYFSSGIFIGAGPWFRGFGDRGGRGFMGRPGFGSGFRPIAGGRGPG